MAALLARCLCPRRLLGGSIAATSFAWVVGCASSASDASPLGEVAGDACNVAGCVATPATGGEAAVIEAVERPTVDLAVSTAPLSAFCGSGCGGDADGATVYPETPGACVEAVIGEDTEGGGGAASGVQGCSIVRGVGNAPVGVCGARGEGTVGDPCIAQGDCSPGFACVGEDGAGQCRPYCCGDPESCPEETFCAARSLLDRDADKLLAPLQVPVCVEAHDCRLDEPYPCPADETCTCAVGTHCTVVRNDGTTGCVEVPESGGLEGQACPCSPFTLNGLGLICSQTTQTCLAICLVGADSSSCGEGRLCQSSASLPEGFGVCTGTLTTDAAE